MNIIKNFEIFQMKNIVELNSGDFVEIKLYNIENFKTRLQNFDGIIISVKNKGIGSSFTVRKIYNNEGVERVFKLYSPNIKSIIIKRRGFMRKSKLYYLRNNIKKCIKLKKK